MAPSSFRRSHGTGTLGMVEATTIAKQQQYVWIPTDLVDAVVKAGSVAGHWKPRQRHRSSTTDWGWCRARVVSSAVVPAPADENAPTARQRPPPPAAAAGSPARNFTLRTCAVSPPALHTGGASTKPATAPLPWGGSPTRPVSKTVSMTVTVDDDEFAPAHLQGVTVSFTYTTGTESSERVCRANDWWLRRNQESPTDLTALEQLHEPAVVYCLSRRYRENHIYTHTGKILLALNPFQYLPDLYGEDVMQHYWQANDAGSVGNGRRPAPHVYAVAEDAYRSAIRSLQSAGKEENQSILVSGESGAGKTVTTKIILQYLAVSSQKSDESAALVGIESQVLESNPILESFGNARTVRNDNSSRFGKFIELQFEPSGCLASASIETYLLEKVRLISQAPGERNFHVFYEVLAGLSSKERRDLHMTGRTAHDFCMTSVSQTIDRRDGVDDRETYKELRNALDTVGFSGKEQLELFTVTCALLFASNLSFVETSPDSSSLDGSNPSLRYAVDLLGVDVGVLNNAVCTCAIEARGETMYKHLSIDRAEKAVEALIKTTYGALFTHIVRRINSFISIRQDHVATRKNGRTTASLAFIGVLDIFGFESFDRNSFEQLCINYCNEALQQQFNRFVFKLEQQEYQREGIDWSFIAFPDNQDVLDLIDKKHDGVLSVLDEQSRLPRCTDATFASAVYQKCFDHPRFEASKAMQAQLSFAIHHYAGLVEYDTECFLEKNQDELSKETTVLLQSSSYPFLAKLGCELTEASSTLSQQSATSRSPRTSKQLQRGSSSLLRDSVGTQFCSQLKTLRTRIESTAPHYVRCLKPNDELVPHNFDALVISDQLRCAGVLEAIRVSRVGFPNRYYHDHFVQRYSLLERRVVAEHKRKKLYGRELCSILVDHLLPKLVNVLDCANNDEQQLTRRPEERYVECFVVGLPDDAFSHSSLPSCAIMAMRSMFLGMQMGKTKVFIRRRTFEALEYIRDKKLEDSAIRLQSVVRMFLRRIIYEISLYAVVLIQKCVRQIGAHRIARELRIVHAAAVIQKALRCSKARRRLQAARSIACWCQSAYRGAIARQYCAYIFLDKKASSIQSAWSRYRSSRMFRNIKRAVLALQTRHRCRKAVRALRRLRVEAKDLSAVAAERDKFKEESNRLRKELDEVKSSPDIPQKPPPSPGRTVVIEKLRSEVHCLQFELDKAHRLSSPSKSVDERDKALADELARKEEELALLRQEVAILRLRDDHSSMKSLAIDTSSRGLSSHGSYTVSSPRHRASPVRSDVSLLDDEIDDELRSLTASGLGVAGDELRHLHTAIRQKSKRHLDQVLQQTSEVCVLVNQGDKYGRTAMHLAALGLDLEIAALLVAKGAVVNAQDDDGETPLHLAENSIMTEFLLKKGKANPNIPNVDGICALHLAVQRRDIDSVRVLVMNHANVNNADNIKWFTALHLIALPARNEGEETTFDDARCRIAQLLTGVYGPNKPDVNYQDSEGNAPLHYAVQLETEDACDLVNVFLEKDANPNLRNMRDQVSFHLLCHNEKLRSRKNYQELINALLLHGADPSIQSRTGCTALHLSLYHKDIDTAVQLVQGGADLHAAWKKVRHAVERRLLPLTKSLYTHIVISSPSAGPHSGTKKRLRGF